MDVDRNHLSRTRSRLGEYAPGGVLHRVLEVLAYAGDEAEHQDGGHATVTVHPDGTIEVSDIGRSTDTGLDDGRARRGMSTVAALSEMLEHTDR